MTPLRVLILHPALAPYRVDMFNALSQKCTLSLALLAENVPNQAFVQARLRSLLIVEPRYLLGGMSIAGRLLRTGIRAEITRFRPDVVVTSEFGPATACVALARYLGGSTFAHVVWTDDNPCSVQAESRLHRLGRRLLLPHADALLTCSEETQAIYREHYGAAQPVVVSQLLQSEDVFRARIDEASEAARRLVEAHHLTNRKVLLYVGRLAPEKRVDRVVDAAERIRSTAPELVLAVIGDGPESSRIRSRTASAAERGHVILTGRLEGSALAAWYRIGSVFLLASDYEPFGAVVNEALVAGIPVICSHKAGARVLVRSGTNGAVVDAARPDELDAAVVACLRRASPVSLPNVSAPRPSLMLSSFAEAVEAYVQALNAARAFRNEARSKPDAPPGGLSRGPR